MGAAAFQTVVVQEFSEFIWLLVPAVVTRELDALDTVDLQALQLAREWNINGNIGLVASSHLVRKR